MPGEDLFSRDNHAGEPLAARMRPRFIDEFVGQEHILGPGKLLRRAIQADMLSSLIFYGPPGTGKTTLARVIANTTRSDFISLNAVLAGVADVRKAIEQARNNRDLYDRRTILFVDEVHRWNKAQQDALLPWVENGTVILIGATTHNPFFEVNSALVSRSRIFQLTRLKDDELHEIARRALADPVRGYGQFDVRVDEDALDHLVAVCEGDARGLLGALQLAVETSVDPFPPEPGTRITIDRRVAEDSIQRKAVLYDKEGDYHFDVISAFIKSIRGSDPDAALYWLARMVHGGEDPRFIFRRLLISASEDIGLADPSALSVVESAAAAFDRVGMPEGRFHLAHATLYLATCPKSNSTLGFFDALKAVESEQTTEVPGHLRDASRDKEGFGHGEGYLYPHAYAEHWVAQSYLPGDLQGRIFYQPSDQGYENAVRERVLRLREIQLEIAVPDETPEVLSYSRAGDRELDRWVARAERQTAEVLTSLRNRVVGETRIARHHAVLVAGNHASLVLWDTVRAAPEGLVVALISSRERCEASRHHAAQAHPLHRPIILDPIEIPLEKLAAATRSEPALDRRQTKGETEASRAADVPEISWEDQVAGVSFDRIILVDAQNLAPSWEELFRHLGRMASAATELVIAQRIPAEGQRLSELVDIPDAALAEHLRCAEQSLFENPAAPHFAWTEQTVTSAAGDTGWRWHACEPMDAPDQRTITIDHIRRWLAPDRAEGLGRAIGDRAGEPVRREIEEHLVAQLAGRKVPWRVRFLVATARRDAKELSNPE